MVRITHLVDSHEYAGANCFQHQLKAALGRYVDDCVSLPRIALGPLGPTVCCLRQRTLAAYVGALAHALDGSPVVIYDQDPWEAVRDGSPTRGVYERACGSMNVKAIAVTSRWWADRLTARGLPATFVRMWMLPEYCSPRPEFDTRPIKVGFVGSLHPHRAALFSRLAQLGIDVQVIAGNSAAYAHYLDTISNVAIHIRSEDSPVIVDGEELNLRDGLWGRDVELAARGCFSIRSAGSGAADYVQGLGTVFTFNDPDEVPDIVRSIERMDPSTRQRTIDGAVELIRSTRAWEETARTLVERLTQ